MVSRSAVVALSLALVLVAGCETGRTNKQHAGWQHLSDVSTTGKPDAPGTQEVRAQPPVPGSPTAAGPDGNQPFNDSDARRRPDNEHGMAAEPGKQGPGSAEPAR